MNRWLPFGLAAAVVISLLALVGALHTPAQVVQVPPADAPAGPLEQPVVLPVADDKPAEPVPEPMPAEPDGPLVARIGDARLRHCGYIHRTSFHPNGKWVVASAGGENGARLWDTDTGEQVRRFTDPDLEPTETRSNVCSVLWFTGDGQRLVAGTGDRVVAFDTDTGRAVARFRTDGYTATHYGVSPVGHLFAGFDTDRLPAVWNLDTGEKVLVGPKCGEKAFEYYRAAPCFSTDGTRMAVCKSSTVVWVCPVTDATAAREIDAAKAGSDGVVRLWWNRPDRLLAQGNAGALLIDTDAGAVLHHDEKNLLPTGAGGWSMPNAEGTRAVTSSWHAVQVRDLATGQQSATIAAIEAQPHQPAQTLALSPHGTRLLADHRVWNLAGGKPTLLRKLDGSGYSNQFPVLSPDGRYSADTTSLQLLAVTDVGSGKGVFKEADPPAQERGGSSVVAIGDPKANSVWVGDGRANELREIELPTAKVLTRLPPFPEVTITRTSPDGKRIAVGGYAGFAVRDTNPASEWQVLEKYPVNMACCTRLPPPCPHTFAFHPDGRLFAVRDRLVIWTTANRPLNPRADTFEKGVRHDGLTFSLDGRRFAVLTDPPDVTRGEVRVYETATLAEVYRIAPGNGVSAVAFSANGRRMVVAHRDTTVTVWSVERLEAERLGKGDATKWADPNPKTGLAGVRALAADPKAALAAVADHFRPADPAKTAPLVADLGSEDFAARERATKALAELGAGAEEALRKAVESPSPEVRNRATDLLRALNPSDGRRSVNGLRAVRAVEVLERVGSKDARAVLAEWANNPGLILSAEARAALARLR